MSLITVVGSLNMDLVVNTPRIPVIGESVLGWGFMTNPGGKGANQAVAASRLGAKVNMVGCVGNDLFGEDIINNLAVNGVDSSNIRRLDNVPSGIAVILIKDGDNCIIIDPGANSKVDAGMADAIDKSVAGSGILLLQLEIPMEAVKMAVGIAKRHGVRVLLNPAPAARLDDDLLRTIDIITPNESECQSITGLPVKSIDEAKAAVAWFMDKGIRQVIITLGSNGVVYNSGSKVLHKPVPKVKVIDTTAAGDSFTAAVAVALSEGKGIDDAVAFANAVGTLTVQKKGAISSLPYRREAEALLSTL